MTSSEYQQLTDFFVDHLGRFKQEIRAFVEVTVESLRYEIRLVADGVLANRRAIEQNTRVLEEHGRLIEGNSIRIEENSIRIEENSVRIEENGIRIEENSVRIEALTSRVERLEGTVSTRFADHERRLHALE